MNQPPEYLLNKLKKDKRYREELTPEYKQLLEEFTCYIKQQQLSDQTIRRSFYMVGKFLAFVLRLKICDIGSVTADVINTFLATMAREASRFSTPISVSYHTDYHINVKKLFAFLCETKKIIINPAAKVTLPKKEDVLPRYVLTREEVKLILAQPNTQTLYGLRDRVILEILYGCGLRSGEAYKLTLDDINMSAKTIHIREAKGAKDRVVPISEMVESWLERYLLLRRLLRPDIKELFLMEGNHEPMKEGYISTIVQKYVKQTGIAKRVVPHTFRHAFATHLLEEGAGLPHIQALLGHSSLDSTQIYTRVALTDLKKGHSMLHPRNRFNLNEDKDDLDQKGFTRRIEPRKTRKSQHAK